MKKIYLNISLLLIGIMFFSCDDKKNISDEICTRLGTIQINKSEIGSGRTNYSTLFDKIEYIQIETDTNYLIGKVDKLLVTDDYLFVMDRRISRSLFAFDNKGNKVTRINKTGSGPDEYVAMKDIVFNKERKELLIHDYMRKKLLYYDLNGEFLKAENIPYNSLRVQSIGDKFGLYTDYNRNPPLQKEGKEPDLILLDSDKKQILSTANYFIQPSAKALVVSSEPKFSQVSDTLYSIKPDHCNIVYHVTPHEIYPAYSIDFGKYGIDDRYWQKVSEKGLTFNEIERYSDELGLCESFWFLEGTNYIYFTYKQKGDLYHILYSKNTKNIHHIKHYQNDMDLVSSFRPVAMHNDKLYCIVDAEDIYNMRNHLVGILPDDILNNIKEFSNPIISVFTLKPF